VGWAAWKYSYCFCYCAHTWTVTWSQGSLQEILLSLPLGIILVDGSSFRIDFILVIYYFENKLFGLFFSLLFYFIYLDASSGDNIVCVCVWVAKGYLWCGFLCWAGFEFREPFFNLLIFLF
jgi:hypothetical protein